MATACCQKSSRIGVLLAPQVPTGLTKNAANLPYPHSVGMTRRREEGVKGAESLRDRYAKRDYTTPRLYAIVKGPNIDNVDLVCIATKQPDYWLLAVLEQTVRGWTSIPSRDRSKPG